LGSSAILSSSSIDINGNISSSKTSSSSSVSSSDSQLFSSSSSWYLPLTGFLSYGEMTDKRDGQKYATIIIKRVSAGQTLYSYNVMAQNLNYGVQVNGMAADDNQVDDIKVEKYCYNDSTIYCERYGGLYQWAEALALPFRCNTDSCVDLVDTLGFHRGICPEGWHLLKEEELTHLGQDGIRALKAEVYWYKGGGGSNRTGFTALPAGVRRASSEGGGFLDFSKYAGFWMNELSVKKTDSAGLAFELSYAIGDGLLPTGTPRYKTGGESIRCVQDY
jgi:uncharacterized protein (TIGR02145 family)